MPVEKRERIQAYLEPEVAAALRELAKQEDRAESRAAAHLIRLGLEAQLSAPLTTK